MVIRMEDDADMPAPSTAQRGGVRVVDLRFQDTERAIAAYLLCDGEDVAVVDPGPTSSMHMLLGELDRAGIARERVSKLLLTHIHLDHAGAAGSLCRLLPRARVYVHEAGARHMADPSKLVASAARIYGESMDRLWGEVLPVPEERLVVPADGEQVAAGGRTLRALYTPGHASHHIAYASTAADGAREVWAGDVAGVLLPGGARALPPTPPPDLDLERWSESLRRLRALQAETLYLTHYGPARGVARHLDDLEERLYRRGGLVLEGARRGLGERELARMLRERMEEEIAEADPGLSHGLDLVAGEAMNVAGYLRYYRKRGDLPG